MGGKQWWNKVGPFANDNANLFIARDHFAREYKITLSIGFITGNEKKVTTGLLKQIDRT